MLKSSGISSEERLSDVGAGNKSSSVKDFELGREEDGAAGMEGDGRVVSLLRGSERWEGSEDGDAVDGSSIGF